jgi:hypothetical protein
VVSLPLADNKIALLGSTTYSSDLDSNVTAVLLVGGDSDPGDVVAVVAAALASTTRNFNSDDDNSHDDDGDDGNEGLMATKDTPEEERGR